VGVTNQKKGKGKETRRLYITTRLSNKEMDRVAISLLFQWTCPVWEGRGEERHQSDSKGRILLRDL